MIDWYQIAVALIMAGAVYGGIRSDLRAMKDSIKAASDSASRAHRRIDDHLQRAD